MKTDQRIRQRNDQGGFTLLEVMLALGLLIGALTVLLLGTGANIQRSQNAYMMGVAADLARAKIYDLEEKMLEEGFQELDLEEEGTFSEEGWPRIKWKVKIEKIELPNLETMGGMAQDEAAQNGKTVDGKPVNGQTPPGRTSSGGGGVMDTLTAMGGGGADGASQAGAMAAYFPLFKGLLEQSIRRITLTVSWKVGNLNEKIVTQVYITDPAGVTRAVFGGGAAGAVGGAGTGAGGTGTGNTRGSTRGFGTRGTTRGSSGRTK